MNPFDRWWDVVQIAETASGPFSVLFGPERYLIYYEDAEIRKFNYQDFHFIHPSDMDYSLRSLAATANI